MPKIYLTNLVRLFVLSLLIVEGLPGVSIGKENGHLYVTWKGIEVDKCASAWLIKRHVDAGAQFRLIPRGELVRDGIPFDTPQGDLRITHRSTTFESILKHYRLDDPILFHMAKVVRDIEMKQWDMPPGGVAEGLEAIIYGLSLHEVENVSALRKSFVIFDYLYEYFKALER